MKTENQFAICVQNEGYPASLELWKVYRVVPDKKAAQHKLVRIIDESGEDVEVGGVVGVGFVVNLPADDGGVVAVVLDHVADQALRVVTVDGTVDVHVLAHSMGAFVVQQAFTWAYQDVPTSWQVAQVLLAAADVDHTVFSSGNTSAKALGSLKAAIFPGKIIVKAK